MHSRIPPRTTVGMNSNLYIKDSTTIKRKCVSLDTLFRDNYENTVSTDCTFTFAEPLTDVISMKVTAVEIPNFWYSFSEINGTNSFVITTYNYQQADITGAVNLYLETRHEIHIPNGNYYNTDMIAYLNNYFINVKGGLQYIIFDINPISGKCIFRARIKNDNNLYPAPYDENTPFYSQDFFYTIDFRFINDIERPISYNMGWMLGFKQPVYMVTYDNTYSSQFVLNDASNNTVFNAYLEGDTTYGNSLINYLFLDIEDYHKSFSNDTIVSTLGNSFMTGNNIIARLTAYAMPNHINFTNAGDHLFKLRQYHGPITIEQLHVRLLDKFGRIMDITNNDYSFLIEFITLNR